MANTGRRPLAPKSINVSDQERSPNAFEKTKLKPTLQPPVKRDTAHPATQLLPVQGQSLGKQGQNLLANTRRDTGAAVGARKAALISPARTPSVKRVAEQQQQP